MRHYRFCIIILIDTEVHMPECELRQCFSGSIRDKFNNRGDGRFDEWGEGRAQKEGARVRDAALIGRPKRVHLI